MSEPPSAQNGTDRYEVFRFVSKNNAFDNFMVSVYRSVETRDKSLLNRGLSITFIRRGDFWRLSGGRKKESNPGDVH